MNTTLGLKNFRVFEGEVDNINLRPITILTGCNSSGKSSIVKATILLNNVLPQIKSGKKVHLDFNQNPLPTLGSFDAVLNKNAAINGDKEICLKYTKDSIYFGDDVSIYLYFSLDDKDITKDGSLKQIIVKDRNGDILYQDEEFNVPKICGIEINHANHEFIRFREGKRTNSVFPELDMLDWMFEADPKANMPRISAMKKYYFAFKKSLQVLEKSCSFKGEGFEQIESEAKDYLTELQKKFGERSVRSLVDAYLSDSIKEEFTCKAITDAEELDILTYLPMLKSLAGIPKSEFVAAFMRAKGKSETGEIEEEIDAFLDSGYESFVDYYRSLENKLLDNQPFYGSCPTFCELTSKYSSFEPVFTILASYSSPKETKEYLLHARAHDEYSHRILNDFLKFFNQGLNDLFSTDDWNEIHYVGSSRLDVKRLYERNDSSSDIISRYAKACRNLGPNLDYKPGSFINKWIKLFGIGERFEIESVQDSLGFVLKIYDAPDDTTGRILADMGYGITQLVSILLEIETTILLTGPHLGSFFDVDSRYPVKKYLADQFFLEKRHEFGSIVEKADSPEEKRYPVYSYCFKNKKPITIAIEEPEIHLHPKYQSLLAQMFSFVSHMYSIHFIIETHSEYLVRKVQTLVASGQITNDNLSILYVDEPKGSNKNRVRRIEVEDDGCLKEPFGPGFFDEADSLAMKLLMIKGGLGK